MKSNRSLSSKVNYKDHYNQAKPYTQHTRLTDPKRAQSHSLRRTLLRPTLEVIAKMVSVNWCSLDGFFRESYTSASKTFPSSNKVNELRLGNVRSESNYGLFCCLGLLLIRSPHSKTAATYRNDFFSDTVRRDEANPERLPSHS